MSRSATPFMSRLFLLALGAVVLAAGASAQKPQAASPLERGADPVFELAADGMTYARTGRSAMLVAMNAYVAPGSDEAMGRAALAQYHGALGLRTAAASDLEFVEAVQSPAGTVVRFRQTVDGVPVWGPMTVVGLDTERRAQSVANGYRADVALASTTPSIEASAARAAVLAHLGAEGDLRLDETTLMVWPALDGARLAWVVRVIAEAPLGDWEAVVDAQTGELLRVADRHVYHGDRPSREAAGRTALPTVESHPLFARADGTAMIFDPDPLTRMGGVAYGTAGYTEGSSSVSSTFCASAANNGSVNCDIDTPQLTAARTSVTMRDVTFTGTEYQLVGPWAEIRQIEAPATGLFPSATGVWDFTRNAQAFEAATTYWHIDNYMRYVNVELGVPARPSLYTGGVRFDPHGQNGADNSRYSGGAQDVAFGEGGVDDAEDADVIIHELGHGLHHWLSGGISNGDGLSEGFGDYVAVSYTRSLGLLNPSSASYNWVFKWDGHNPFWPGRVTNFTSTYPAGTAPHARGQHWGTSNMRIWNTLGRERTDKAVFEGLRLTNSATTQPQAANAVMQAAANMGYTLAEVQAMFASYQTQGYPGLVMPNIVSTEADAGRQQAVLTAASPNPFNGLTTFELVVDRDQRVTVEVFDALGRQVATLFEGNARAGGRYPFALEAAGLRPGVYVYRATGETFSLSQRATLVR